MPRSGSELNAANDSIAADSIERDFVEATHELRQALAIEAELHMPAAFFTLNLATPDLASAQRHALRLCPHWRYVRDRLLRQIARRSATG